MSSIASPTDLKHRRLEHWSRFSAGKDLTGLGIDLRPGKDHVAGFLEDSLARIHDEDVGHHPVVELPPIGPWRADGIHMRSSLEPIPVEDRLERVRSRPKHIRGAQRGGG